MVSVTRKADSDNLKKSAELQEEKNKRISDQINELKELVNRKHIRTEALLSLGLEKESITQDKFDELMNMLKEFGRQKGFKVK